MIGSYGYTDARVTEDPTSARQAVARTSPLNTASLYLVYDFGTALPGRLRLGAGARYVGDRPGDRQQQLCTCRPTRSRTSSRPTRPRFDTFPVIYQFNVKNLFDNVYYHPPPATI